MAVDIPGQPVRRVPGRGAWEPDRDLIDAAGNVLHPQRFYVLLEGEDGVSGATTRATDLEASIKGNRKLSPEHWPASSRPMHSLACFPVGHHHYQRNPDQITPTKSSVTFEIFHQPRGPALEYFRGMLGRGTAPT
jgi:hypothetical protein